MHGATCFADLADRIAAMGEGTDLRFVDWRGGPDRQLNDAGDTLVDVLVAALGRRVDVRGLLWRSHWRKFGFRSGRPSGWARPWEAHGGECLQDMQVHRWCPPPDSWFSRHRDDPTRDVAYVGGIDLCHSRRDDHGHGAIPALAIAPSTARTRRGDVQVAVRGPAVHDVETTFRERWEDDAPLTSNPVAGSPPGCRPRTRIPIPSGEQWPPPPPVAGATDVVQIARPPAAPPGAPRLRARWGAIDRLGNAKAMSNARRLVYVEDQYLWGPERGSFADALRDNPDLRWSSSAGPARPRRHRVADDQWRPAAPRLDPIRRRGDRMASSADHGRRTADLRPPKVCIIDDRWAQCRLGQPQPPVLVQRQRDRVFRHGRAHRSWPPTRRLPTTSSAPACAGCSVPSTGHRRTTSPTTHELFDLLVDSATALDKWYAAGAGDQPAAYVGPVARVHGRRRRTPVVAQAQSRPGGAMRRRTFWSAAPASRNGHRANCGC